MLTKRVSRIGQTLAWITGRMRGSSSRLGQFREGLITVNSESFEGSVTEGR